MSFISSDLFVQTEYPDWHGRGFPGQYFNLKDAAINKAQSFPVDTGQFIFCGRLVVRAEDQDASDGTLPTSAPFSVRTLIITDTDVTKYVGVTIRSMSGNLNNVDVDDERKAGFAEKQIAPILPLGSGQVLLVRQEPALAIVYGDAVYVATDPTNDANINVGEFSNAAGTNLVLVPNAFWFLPKTATSLDPVGAIQFA